MLKQLVPVTVPVGKGGRTLRSGDRPLTNLCVFSVMFKWFNQETFVEKREGATITLDYAAEYVQGRRQEFGGRGRSLKLDACYLCAIF